MTDTADATDAPAATEGGVETDAGGTSRTDEDVTFTLGGVRDGYLACVPVAAGVAGYGVGFGLLAKQAGLSVAEATLMSATVLAGAAQLVAVEVWRDPVPAAAVVGTTLVVNLRYLLMGATLRPWFATLSPSRAYGSAFFMADENWALTVADLRSGSGRGAFLLGSGLAIWSFWVAATVLGATAGGAVADPARFGLDFVLAAVFATIAVDLWDGRGDLGPWAAAAVVAVAAAAALPGYWYVILGGLAAVVAEVAAGD